MAADKIVFLVVHGAWLLLSIVLVLVLKVYSPSRLLGAPARRGLLTLFFAVGVFLLYIGGQVVAGVVVASVHAGLAGKAAATQALAAPEDDPQRMAELGIATTVVWIFFVYILLQMMRRMMQGGIAGWGLSRRGILKGIGWGIIGFVIVVPWMEVVSSGMSMLLSWFGRQSTIHPTLLALREPMPLWSEGVLLATAGLVAPVVEEMVFRGVLQTALIQHGWGMLLQAGDGGGDFRPTAGHRWGAIVITAALFAGMHFFIPDQVPVLFVLGVGLGYVYERTGNLWAAITLHAVFNCVNLAGLLLSKT